MAMTTTRRTFLGAALALPLAARPQDRRVLIDTHIHLFAADQDRFPYHPNGPYQPAPSDLKPYIQFVSQTVLNNTVIVHPEPYQDDHRYLEYCFEQEPSPGFFKGTILLDAFAADTPERMRKLAERNQGRIVAARVHAMNPKGEAPSSTGPIKNRDLRDPRMQAMWEAATDLGIAIQMHFLPHHAPEIGELMAKVPQATVILDHLGRAGMGTDKDFGGVLALAKHAKCYMKLSGVRYSSKTDYPYLDAKRYIRPAYDRFGADRMIWGGLGKTVAELDANLRMLDQLLDFAPESDRAKVRGLTAQRLFGFRG